VKKVGERIIAQPTSREVAFPQVELAGQRFVRLEAGFRLMKALTISPATVNNPQVEDGVLGNPGNAERANSGATRPKGPIVTVEKRRRLPIGYSPSRAVGMEAGG